MRRIPGSLYMLMMLTPSTSVTAHLMSLLVGEIAILCHMAELMTNAAVPYMPLMICAARE